MTTLNDNRIGSDERRCIRSCLPRLTVFRHDVTFLHNASKFRCFFERLECIQDVRRNCTAQKVQRTVIVQQLTNLSGINVFSVWFLVKCPLREHLEVERTFVFVTADDDNFFVFELDAFEERQLHYTLDILCPGLVTVHEVTNTLHVQNAALVITSPSFGRRLVIRPPHDHFTTLIGSERIFRRARFLGTANEDNDVVCQRSCLLDQFSVLIVERLEATDYYSQFVLLGHKESPYQNISLSSID
ncbi:hypothetical protein D3C80_1223910 [compost metagenome]